MTITSSILAWIGAIASLSVINAAIYNFMKKPVFSVKYSVPEVNKKNTLSITVENKTDVRTEVLNIEVLPQDNTDTIIWAIEKEKEKLCEKISKPLSRHTIRLCGEYIGKTNRVDLEREILGITSKEKENYKEEGVIEIEFTYKKFKFFNSKKQTVRLDYNEFIDEFGAYADNSGCFRPPMGM